MGQRPGRLEPRNIWDRCVRSEVEENLVARADLVLLSRDPAVAWFDVPQWSHAFRLARLFGHIN